MVKDYNSKYRFEWYDLSGFLTLILFLGRVTYKWNQQRCCFWERTLAGSLPSYLISYLSVLSVVIYECMIPRMCDKMMTIIKNDLEYPRYFLTVTSL